MQKDTCKKTIEFSFVVAINQKKLPQMTSLDSSWKEFDSTQRKELFDYVKENTEGYTECSDYPYLIKGEEVDGSELLLFIRKADSDRIEIKMGK